MNIYIHIYTCIYIYVYMYIYSSHWTRTSITVVFIPGAALKDEADTNACTQTNIYIHTGVYKYISLLQNTGLSKKPTNRCHPVREAGL